MGDVGDWARAMTSDRQQRHAEWHTKNLAELRAAGMPFVERATSCLFREPGKPKVDFYPHTGRWRVVGGQSRKTFRGGASAFVSWYRKQ